MCQPKHELTQDGIKQLKLKKDQLQVKVNRLTNQLEENAEGESTLENTEYHELVRERMFLKSRINEISEILENTKKITQHKHNRVTTGCVVKLSNHTLCRVLQIVESVEANPREGKISTDSPIGKVIVGKKEGEKVEVPTPSGKTEYKIIEIY